MSDLEEKARKKREAQDRSNQRRREKWANMTQEEKRKRKGDLMVRKGDQIRESQKKYREKHKDERSQQNREWCARNREKRRLRRIELDSNRQEELKEYRRQYTKKNREEILSKMKAYRDSNKEKMRALQKEWRDKNPDVVLFHTRTRKSRIRGQGGSVSKAELDTILESQKHICIGCGISLRESTPHMDHIMPLSKGGTHSADNIQFLCAPCNQSKHAKHPLDWVLEIYKKEKY